MTTNENIFGVQQIISVKLRNVAFCRRYGRLLWPSDVSCFHTRAKMIGREAQKLDKHDCKQPNRPFAFARKAALRLNFRPLVVINKSNLRRSADCVRPSTHGAIAIWGASSAALHRARAQSLSAIGAQFARIVENRMQRVDAASDDRVRRSSRSTRCAPCFDRVRVNAIRVDDCRRAARDQLRL